MANSNDSAGGMGKLSKKTREKVDAALQDKEAALLKNTSIDLKLLRPKVSDKESFDKLINAITIATQQNESIAQLQNRIMGLGEGVFKVAKEILTMIP